MKVIIWDSTGKIIKQTEDDIDIPMYISFAEARGYSYLCKDIKDFPEEGWTLDNKGVYRELKLSEKNINLKSEEEIRVDDRGEEYIYVMTEQEQVSKGIVNLDFIKEKAYKRITKEVTEYLENSKTESGHIVNDYAQKICSMTYIWINVDDKDVQKKSLLNAGLIYDKNKADEILNFLVSVKASRDVACSNIKKSKTVAAIDKIKFIDYI